MPFAYLASFREMQQLVKVTSHSMAASNASFQRLATGPDALFCINIINFVNRAQDLRVSDL